MKGLESKEKFIELRTAGNSLASIAKTLGVTKQTLIDWDKEFKHEIANLKSIRMEELYQKYLFNSEAKIQAYGELVEKIKLEISERTLTDISTDKLIDLLLRMYGLIEKEILPFKSTKEIETAKEDQKFISG